MANAGHVFAQQTEWVHHKTADGQHPSALEQQMLWLMNRARANPADEGNFLSATGDRDIVIGILQFLVDLNRMKSEFQAIKPAPPAAFDRRLYEASRQHAEYMIQRNDQTHDRQNDFLNDCGFDWQVARLSIYAYGSNALMTHAALNIDFGGPPSEGGMQAGRGHRVAIMSTVPDVDLSSVGLALVAENNPLTQVGPYVFSGAYASAYVGYVPDNYNRFIVGTVWTDRNGNGRYDLGEGLNGVHVQLDRGRYYAVTGIAGGFSIPVFGTGKYVITYSGGEFPGTRFSQVNLGNVSVLAEGETSKLAAAAPVPPAATLRRESPRSMMLSWVGGKGPWQVQEAATVEGPWRNVGSATQETSVVTPTTEKSKFFRVVSPD
ncbi:MAG: hypothetical protein EOP86_00445 [Verrucomicrobiaceae bacterium]|nr:MAG: hypothetical protein EOP86_00445 [Verrucomicrobiaceae bacterium]